MDTYYALQTMLRTTTAYIAAPILAKTGKRFDQIHRKTDTLTYKLVDTVLANHLAQTRRPGA